jgi:hypothetical protein
MTAVAWLIEQIDNKDMGEIPMWVYDLCYDAQEMEERQKKQQIMDAWDRGLYIGQIFPQGNIENIYEQDSEQYYSETYKSE